MGTVEVTLPGAAPIVMETVRLVRADDGSDQASLRVVTGDWAAYRATSLWLFHTPSGLVDGLPAGAPAVAARTPTDAQPDVLARQLGR